MRLSASAGTGRQMFRSKNHLFWLPAHTSQKSVTSLQKVQCLGIIFQTKYVQKNLFPPERLDIIMFEKLLRPRDLEGRVITALIWTVGQPHPKTKHLRDILVSMSKLTHPRFSHSEYFQPLSIGLFRTTLFQQEE